MPQRNLFTVTIEIIDRLAATLAGRAIQVAGYGNHKTFFCGRIKFFNLNARNIQGDL